MLDVSNVHILGPVYYHATHERAEVMNRVHYTTWIKSKGEAERVLSCVSANLRRVTFLRHTKWMHIRSVGDMFSCNNDYSYSVILLANTQVQDQCPNT